MEVCMHLSDGGILMRNEARMATMAAKLSNSVSIPEATDDEAKAAFDHTARFYTGLSGAEFLELYDSGKLDPTSTKVQHVLTMLSFVR